jgi:hypothetical protein
MSALDYEKFAIRCGNSIRTPRPTIEDFNFAKNVASAEQIEHCFVTFYGYDTGLHNAVANGEHGRAGVSFGKDSGAAIRNSPCDAGSQPVDLFRA